MIFLLILALILLIGGVFLVIFGEKNLTGRVIISEYSYTKAVCNESNYCEDYEVVCDAENVKSLTPTGYVVQLSEDWVDERDDKNFDRLC